MVVLLGQQTWATTLSGKPWHDGNCTLESVPTSVPLVKDAWGGQGWLQYSTVVRRTGDALAARQHPKAKTSKLRYVATIAPCPFATALHHHDHGTVRYGTSHLSQTPALAGAHATC